MVEQELRESIRLLANQVETLVGRADQTDAHTAVALQELRVRIAHAGGQGGEGPRAGERHELRLLSDRDVKPAFFAGARNDVLRELSKKNKTFLNTKSNSFRYILQWAEVQTGPISTEDLDLQNWNEGAVGNIKLYDFLCSVCTGGALDIVEMANGSGVEAWR